MPHMTDQADQHRAGERGFSLVVVMFFVGLIAALIAMSVQNQRGAVQRDQARAAGWHLAQISKAARIYVRDRSLTSADPYHKSALAAGGIAISLAELEAAGLLPSNTPDTNVIGQSVRVFAANYPVDGNPASTRTVASAYVVLEDSVQSRGNPSLMQYLTEGARAHGLYVNAPIFSESGDNISDACNGAPGYALWDTGCLNLADYSVITGENDFTIGSLIVPAWRSDIPDTRAVMRFPQPENTGYATMMTALEMAPVDRNADGSCVETIQIYDYSAGNIPIDTGLCRTRDDGVAAAPESGDPAYVDSDDARRDIINVAGMTVNSVIAAAQDYGESGVAETSFRYDGSNNPVWRDEYRSVTQYDYSEVLHVTGNLETGSNVHATARMANPSNDGSVDQFPIVGFANETGTDWANLRVDHNIFADQDITVNGSATLHQASVAELNNALPGADNPAVIGGRLDADDLIVGTAVIDAGGNGFAAARMDAGAVTIETQDADFFSALDTTGTTNVTQDMRDAEVPAIVVYSLEGGGDVNAQSMTVGGSLALDGNLAVQGNADMTVCAGGVQCPDITPPPGEPLD